MSLLRGVVVAALAFLLAHPARAETRVSPLPVVDFKQWFPWLVWVSSEGHDAEYPDGFIYKVLSERDADSKLVDFVLVRQLHDGSKIVAIHAKGPLDKFDATASAMVEHLGKPLGITFQRFDLRDVKTLEDLRERARSFGWDADVAPSK
jgi:hypothetical protein